MTQPHKLSGGQMKTIAISYQPNNIGKIEKIKEILENDKNFSMVFGTEKEITAEIQTDKDFVPKDSEDFPMLDWIEETLRKALGDHYEDDGFYSGEIAE